MVSSQITTHPESYQLHIPLGTFKNRMKANGTSDSSQFSECLRTEKTRHRGGSCEVAVSERAIEGRFVGPIIRGGPEQRLALNSRTHPAKTRSLW